MVKFLFRQSIAFASIVLTSAIVWAQPNMAPTANPAAPAKPAGEKPLREIFVPFDDLQVILESDKNRVFLTRQEYEDLLKVVKEKAAKQGPVNVVVLQAAYTGKIDDGRAQITGKIELDVVNDGWQVVPLDVGYVGIQSATLDGKPATIARDERGRIKLFVSGAGKHQLELQLTAAVPAAAALQTLNVMLPTATSATFELSVAGNVEVKGGASVVRRKYDEAANRTQLELILERGVMSIVMSLNNKQAREQRLVVARTIQVDEITLGYERLHVNVSLRILHDPVDRFRFAIPAGFEVTTVNSQRLSRWEVKEGDKGQKILEAILSEGTTEPTVIAITANRSPELGQDWLASLQKWKLPRIQPLDVAGEVAVVGLLVEKRLEAQELTTKQLLPIDSPILTQSMPESIFRAEPGAPIVSPIATYYVPAYIDATQYDLTANFVRPETGLIASTSLLLSLSDQGHELRGGFVVSPLAEDLFQVRLKAPLGWRVQEVLGPNNQPLTIERYELADGSTRLLVTLAAKIEAGKRGTIIVRATSNPAGWLADWKEQTVTFPQLEIEGASRETGAIAVQTGDDLAVQPQELSGLVPLLESEKPEQGLAGVPTAAAYRFESRPFAAKFVVERKQPSLAAEVFNFLQILPDALQANYELIYQVREARTRQLVFSLPASTPKELTIQGLDGVAVKEYRSSDDGDRRRWTVQLAERVRGEIRLTVSFRQPIPEKELKAYSLPLIQAEDVEFQSAFASLEGSPELEVTPTTAHRTVDEAELYQARFLLEQPATGGDRRLIGAYGYSGTSGAIKVEVNRRQQHALPSAIVQHASLVTRVSANGLTQSIARYDLVTKATILQVALPDDTVLWTMLVDGQPTKPQREKNALLVSLPPRDGVAVRSVQLVYETTGNALAMSTTIEAHAPKLLLRGSTPEQDRVVPQANLQWKLILPSGYQLRSSSGTVTPVKKQRPPLAALKVAGVIYELGGGVGQRHDRRDFDLAGGVAISPKSSPFLNDQSESMNRERYERTMSLPEGIPPPMDAPVAPAADPFGAPAPALTPAETAPPPPPTSEPAPAPEAPKPVIPEFQPPAGPESKSEPKPADPGMPLVTNGEESKSKVAAQEKERQAFATLEGVSSLQIEFPKGDAKDEVVFRSLGTDPVLQVTLVDKTRVYYAAYGIGLLVFLMGVALTFRPAKQQASYVVIFLLGSALPVLLTSMFDEIGPVFDAAFYAACALVPYFLIASVCLSLWRIIVARLPAGCCQAEAPIEATRVTPTGTMLAPLFLLAIFLSSAEQSFAQAPVVEGAKVIDLKDLLPLLDAGGPVTVPADAVIVPYDPNVEDGPAQAKKVLIPYAKFIELWNRAHPDKPKETKPAPVDYAVLSAAYEATLSASDELVVTGKLTIDVLSEKPVAIPLPFSGGVLVKATLEGKPARLQVIAPQAPVANEPAQQMQQQAKEMPNAPDAASGGVIVLHTEGAGRKEAEVQFRLGLARRGGWRQVNASLPLAGATKLILTVPEAATEVRIASTFDRDNFETKAAGEKIETTLVGGGSGRLDLQWRPKVAVGQIDQSLTSKSTGVLDVREDALRLTWVAELSFGRGTRDQFEFSLPLGYSIEQVVGVNLRGWQVKPDAARQIVEATLLKPATGAEQITLVLSKRGRIGTGEFATFEAPAVFVSGAALQQGEIMVRRSPRLELRTESATGLVRADSDNKLAATVQAADSEDPSILNLRPYQVYRFVTSGAADRFVLKLSAAETAVTTSAEVRTVLRIADRGVTLEANLKFKPQGQPLYRADVLLPAGFELDQLLPADVNWSVTNDAANGRKKLSVQLLDGREHEFNLTLLGRFGKREKWEEVDAPVIGVLGVERQEGEIVVLSDPDTDVQVTNLKNAEAGQLQQSSSWLKAEQQPLARAVLKYRDPDYSATFKLTRRTPRVTVRTLSNVKVTRRAIEETLMLEYQIADAGIRELKFELPKSFQTARIGIPAGLLQRKKIEPAENDSILVTLSLQDDVTESLNVIVEHDRLLTDQPQEVAIPRSLTGTTSQRLVVIENTGRDEVVEVKRAGLEPLSRQQQAWQDVIRLLGGGGDTITQAYVGVGDSTPSLTFKTQQNQQVLTAKARIEFARTLLLVDEAGGYRARVEFQVNNSTEQYLDIALPSGAQLWTAVVKGQPVKPVEHEPAVNGKIRIPLIKSPAGSGDYAVEIKYGGNLGRLSTLKQVDFPLIRTENINVEHSQVQLYLPEGYEWPYFGGTMSRVKSAADLEKGLQQYFQKKVAEAKLALQSNDLNTQIRAQANLSGLMQQWQFNSYNLASNELRELDLSRRNYAELQSAQTEANQQVLDLLNETAASDNRGRLNEAWANQKVARSKNVVTQLGNNFDQPAEGKVGQPSGGEGKKELAYNPNFLKGNKLDTEAANEKVIQEELQKQIDEQTLAPAKKPSADQTVQPQPQFQGRVAKSGKVQQFSKELEGDRAGLAQELNNPQVQPSQGQGQPQGNQPPGGRGPGGFGEPGQSGSGQGGGRFGQGMGAGRGQGERPEEELDQQSYNLRQRDSAFRYQQKLNQEQQAQQALQLPAQPAYDNAPPVPQLTVPQPGTPQMGGFNADAARLGTVGGGGQRPADPFDDEGRSFSMGLTPSGPTANLAGLASLDVQLPIPTDRQPIMFETPRGQIEITAQPVSKDLVNRLTSLGILALLIAAGVIAYRLGRQLPLRQATGTMAFAILLILLGLLSWFLNVLPWFGAILFVIGVILAIRRALDYRRTRSAATPATSP